MPPFPYVLQVEAREFLGPGDPNLTVILTSAGLVACFLIVLIMGLWVRCEWGRHIHIAFLKTAHHVSQKMPWGSRRANTIATVRTILSANHQNNAGGVRRPNGLFVTVPASDVNQNFAFGTVDLNNGRRIPGIWDVAGGVTPDMEHMLKHPNRSWTSSGPLSSNPQSPRSQASQGSKSGARYCQIKSIEDEQDAHIGLSIPAAADEEFINLPIELERLERSHDYESQNTQEQIMRHQNLIGGILSRTTFIDHPPSSSSSQRPLLTVSTPHTDDTITGKPHDEQNHTVIMQNSQPSEPQLSMDESEPESTGIISNEYEADENVLVDYEQDVEGYEDEIAAANSDSDEEFGQPTATINVPRQRAHLSPSLTASYANSIESLGRVGSFGLIPPSIILNHTLDSTVSTSASTSASTAASDTDTFFSPKPSVTYNNNGAVGDSKCILSVIQHDPTTGNISSSNIPNATSTNSPSLKVEVPNEGRRWSSCLPREFRLPAIEESSSEEESETTSRDVVLLGPLQKNDSPTRAPPESAKDFLSALPQTPSKKGRGSAEEHDGNPGTHRRHSAPVIGSPGYVRFTKSMSEDFAFMSQLTNAGLSAQLRRTSRILLSDEEESVSMNQLSQYFRHQYRVGSWGHGVVVYGFDDPEFEDRVTRLRILVARAINGDLVDDLIEEQLRAIHDAGGHRWTDQSAQDQKDAADD